MDAKDTDYVTRVECMTTSSEIKNDLRAIKVALIGIDMQGGIVKKINDLDGKVVDLALNGTKRDAAACKKEEDKEEKEKIRIEAWSREKVALIGAVGAIIGLVVGHLLDIIA